MDETRKEQLVDVILEAMAAASGVIQEGKNGWAVWLQVRRQLALAICASKALQDIGGQPLWLLGGYCGDSARAQCDLGDALGRDEDEGVVE